MKSKAVTDAMEQVWLGVSQMKASVMKLIDSDNDGYIKLSRYSLLLQVTILIYCHNNNMMSSILISIRKWFVLKCLEYYKILMSYVM